MSKRSLEDLLGSVESPVELLRNSQTGPNVYPGVPAEYTNWRDEQTAWQQTCVLFNQSLPHGRPRRRGARTPATLLYRARRSTASRTSPSTRRSTSCPCTPEGYVIGDVILFYLAENSFNLVGRAPALNWITYHAETGGYDVDGSSSTSAPRCAPTGSAALLPVPGPGPERDGRDRAGARRAGRRS